MIVRGLLACVLIVSLAACAETPKPSVRKTTVSCGPLMPDMGAITPTMLEAPQADTMKPLPLDSVSVTDPDLYGLILVQAVGARRTATNTVEVMTRLVNCTNSPLLVQGRTHFLSEGQGSVEPVSAWKLVNMAPKAIGHYSESSIEVDKVGNYLIELRMNQ